MSSSIHAPVKWMRVEDLVTRYGVSRWTIAAWEREGRIPKADRSLGRPRWWGPMVEDWDRRRVEAVQ